MSIAKTNTRYKSTQTKLKQNSTQASAIKSSISNQLKHQQSTQAQATETRTQSTEQTKAQGIGVKNWWYDKKVVKR